MRVRTIYTRMMTAVRFGGVAASLAVCALWVRSMTHRDTLGKFWVDAAQRGEHSRSVMSQSGAIEVSRWDTLHSPESFDRLILMVRGPLPTYDDARWGRRTGRPYVQDPTRAWHHRIGFNLEVVRQAPRRDDAGNVTATRTGFRAGVPHGVVAAALAGPAAVAWLPAALRAMRRRRRVRRGQCPHCGYDLRGVDDLCPECGRPRG